MHLRLGKEDLLTLLLRLRYFHCLTEVTTLKVAEKLHSTPCELMHWHECRLLGHAKPENQLVAYVWEPGDGLEVILDTLVEVCLCMICIIWALLCNDAGPLGHAYALKALPHETKPQWTILLFVYPIVQSKSLT